MAAASGLQEMLLQSYGGIIRIFPAIPKTWQDVSFFQLRAEGAFLVSARKQDGRLDKIEVYAEKGGHLKFANPFGEQSFELELSGATYRKNESDILIFECEKGAKVTLIGN